MDYCEELWDYLIYNAYATEDEIQLVVDINGYNKETLDSILYVRSGYRDLEQIKELEEQS